jgi:Excreted virulence factor EspC, type VII ESX diderm
MLRVQPEQLTSSARALRDVTEVSRALDASRGEITDQLSRAGSDPVARSAEAFLDAWSLGLRGVSEHVARLGGTLHTAASEYQQAEHRLRGQLGADGGSS